jgi:hypothetical protein
LGSSLKTLELEACDDLALGCVFLYIFSVVSLKMSAAAAACVVNTRTVHRTAPRVLALNFMVREICSQGSTGS